MIAVEDRLNALAIAFEYQNQRKTRLPFSHGVESGEAWIVTQPLATHRITVWRVRVALQESGPTPVIDTWEFSPEELEAERAKMRGAPDVTVDQIIRAYGQEDDGG